MPILKCFRGAAMRARAPAAKRRRLWTPPLYQSCYYTAASRKRCTACRKRLTINMGGVCRRCLEAGKGVAG